MDMIPPSAQLAGKAAPFAGLFVRLHIFAVIAGIPAQNILLQLFLAECSAEDFNILFMYSLQFSGAECFQKLRAYLFALLEQQFAFHGDGHAAIGAEGLFLREKFP